MILLGQHDVKNRDANRFVAPVRLEDWNRMNSTFQSISGYYMDDLSETSGPLPEKVTEAMVAPRFLRVMGVSPILGRNFTPEDETWGGPAVVLISYGFWQRRFHGSPDALNQKVRVGRICLLDRRRDAALICLSEPRGGSLGAERPRRSLCTTPGFDLVYGHRTIENRSAAC